MEHCEVGVGSFLPAGEDAAEAVEPGVGAFDDPAAGAEACLVFDRFRLVPAAADVGGERELFGEVTDLFVVVGGVEAEALRSLPGRPGAFDRDRLDRPPRELVIV